MYEVEAKVPITAAQFKSLQKSLGGFAKAMGTSLKSDSYFGDPKKAYLRLREVGEGTSLFTIKRKHTEGGVEKNMELEWGIADTTLWRQLLESCGLSASLTKEKKTGLYQWRGFNIELNHVKGLGHFLEIEKSLKGEGGVGAVQRELVEIFALLGFSPEQFEGRSYLSLLKK